jgi:hypothetical protein
VFQLVQKCLGTKENYWLGAGKPELFLRDRNNLLLENKDFAVFGVL